LRAASTGPREALGLFDLDFLLGWVGSNSLSEESLGPCFLAWAPTQGVQGYKGEKKGKLTVCNVQEFVPVGDEGVVVEDVGRSSFCDDRNG
jgi:hypothetical protein